MKPRMLSDVATVVAGTLQGQDVEVRSVVVDSRGASEGALFVALPGEHADGHDYVSAAFAQGVSGALVGRAIHGVAGAQVVVADPLAALQALATDERRRSRAKVVGITGSAGKTLTKDLLAAVLATKFDVQASSGSFNNEIGLPLTLLASDESTDVIVTEMGARGEGHIAALCVIAAPDIGIVTNVGMAHIELFGDQDAIGRAKGELIASLGPDGVAVLNEDDPVVRTYDTLTDARIVRVGNSERAEIRAERVRLTDDGRAMFDLVTVDAVVPVELAIAGEHMVANALAAAGAGLALGVTAPEIASALATAKGSPWRMEVFTSPEGVVVVNDAYNANPASMAAALKAARWLARDSRMAAVLGTMRELGHLSVQEHERVGDLATRLRVERLISVGKEARPIAIAALREGMPPETVASYEDADEALRDVRAWANPGDVVLFKGSRAMGLERVAEAMRT